MKELGLLTPSEKELDRALKEMEKHNERTKEQR